MASVKVAIFTPFNPATGGRGRHLPQYPSLPAGR